MSETEVATEHQEVDTDNLDAFADDFFGQKPGKEAPKTKEPEAAQEGDAEEVVASGVCAWGCPGPDGDPGVPASLCPTALGVAA